MRVRVVEKLTPGQLTTNELLIYIPNYLCSNTRPQILIFEMFSHISTVVIVSLAVLTAAAPHSGGDNVQQRNMGSLYCCNSIQQAENIGSILELSPWIDETT